VDELAFADGLVGLRPAWVVVWSLEEHYGGTGDMSQDVQGGGIVIEEFVFAETVFFVGGFFWENL
jgi:hypothetical protein